MKFCRTISYKVRLSDAESIGDIYCLPNSFIGFCVGKRMKTINKSDINVARCILGQLSATSLLEPFGMNVLFLK